MNSSRHYILGLLAIGLQAGIAAAQGPKDARPPASPAPVAPMPVAAVPAGEVGSVSAPEEGFASPESPASTGYASGMIAGAGFYYMKPFFQNNLAYTVFSQRQFTPLPFDPNRPNSQTLGEAAQRVDVESHMAVAPLLWLGYVNEDGFGGRARLWSFQEGTSQTASLPPFAGQIYIGIQTQEPPPHPVIAVTGNQVTISSATPLGLQAFGNTVGIQHGAESLAFNVTTKLRVNVLDLELLQGARAAGCNFLVVGGVRLVRMEQTYNAYDKESGSANSFRSLVSSNNFSGLGPTIAAEARLPIADSGLSLFSSARGAVVFGSAQQNAQFSGLELRNDDPNPQFATEHRDRALPIAELEAGVQYGRGVGNSWMFGQIALVGQEWFAAGSSSRSTNATVPTTLRPVLGGAPLDSNIAFLGVSVRMGVQF